MKICIIGAGPAGLVSLKHALNDGHECDAFEQTGELGGTWVYTDKVGTDENGVPVHSSMYKGLRTNLPKEVMSFSDLAYPESLTKSYISQEEVLKYLRNYANAFNLHKHIKYFMCVTYVEPIDDSKWSVKVKEVKTGKEETIIYDSVFVCNGHNYKPNMPEIPGQNVFKGVQSHSYYYRTPDSYRNKRVLVIGAGSSGIDICEKLLKVAQHVYISFRSNPGIQFEDNFTGKPVVVRLYENGAIFQDGSREEIDTILYCTGYMYTYPFLSKRCDITVQDNWVQSLYKHIVNAKHPTMFFIGNVSLLPFIPVEEVQARFALAELKKRFLPSVNAMLSELSKHEEDKRIRNVRYRFYHVIGPENLETYLLDLTKMANIPRVPSVLSKLYARVRMNKNLEDCFKIIDDDNFVQINC